MAYWRPTSSTRQPPPFGRPVRHEAAKAGIVRLFACRFRVQLRHGPSQMAATFFQSVMEGERRRVSRKPSQALSPNDLGDSFGARIFRDAKTHAVFPSRYSGKAKLAQFSRPDIAGKQNSRSFLSSEFSR